MNNIPAFPTPTPFADEGMDLRDYFAAKAMQALLVPKEAHNADWIAHDAYIVAAAMMRARGI